MNIYYNCSILQYFQTKVHSALSTILQLIYRIYFSEIITWTEADEYIYILNFLITIVTDYSKTVKKQQLLILKNSLFHL